MKKLYALFVLFLLVLTGCNLIPSAQYTITFDSNGGGPVSSISTDGKTLGTLPTAPEKEGFLFDGWFFDNETFAIELNLENLIAQSITADITVYAKWIEDSVETFTVTFETVGGTTIEPVEVTSGGLLPTTLVTTKEGFTFAGWYLEENYTTSWNSSTSTVEDDITLYAKWSEQSFVISFEENGGSEVTDISAAFGSVITTPPDPVKEGSTFGGWYTDTLFITLYTFSTMPGANTTLYAKWTINQYTISFEENGGSEVVNITADYASSITAPAAPTKEGHDFGGWYTDALFTNVYTFTTMPAGDLTIYVKWNVLQYSFSFEENGGSEVVNITADFGSVVASPLSTKTGYTLTGWYTDALFTTLYTFSTMPAANTTLYAKWTINQYTISFEENGGSEVSNLVADYASSLTLHKK